MPHILPCAPVAWGERGELVWWASLESPRTGERMGFRSAADLFTFLEEEVRDAGKGDEHRPHGQLSRKERTRDGARW